MATSLQSDKRSARCLLAFGWLFVAAFVGCRGGCGARLQPEGTPPELIRRLPSLPEETPVRLDIDDASPAFLVVGARGPIRIWTEGAGAVGPQASIPDAGTVLEARFSAAGVFVVPEQGPITLWNWHDGRVLQTFHFAHHGHRAAVSADGRFVAVGGAVLEVATDRELGISKPLSTESSLAFSASGKRVVSAGFHEPWIIVRDLPSGATREWLAPDKVVSVALSPSADLVAASVKGGRVHFWRLPSGQEQGFWDARGDVRDLCFGSSGGSIVVVDAEGLSLVDIARTRQTWRANLEGTPWTFACDGDLVAAGTQQGEVWLWDVARQVLRARIRLSSSAVVALDVNSTRQRVAAADEQGETAIWGWRKP